MCYLTPFMKEVSVEKEEELSFKFLRVRVPNIDMFLKPFSNNKIYTKFTVVYSTQAFYFTFLVSDSVMRFMPRKKDEFEISLLHMFTSM